MDSDWYTPGRPRREQAGRRIVDDIGRGSIARIVRPGVDRILEKRHRAVEEPEVAAAGMEARRGDREVVLLGVEAVEKVAVGVVADPAERIHGIERGEQRVAEVPETQAPL